MSKFDADYYRRFRPYYPAALYAELARSLVERGGQAPWAVADLGCGTGHSSESLLRAIPDARVRGVDPDPRMLEQAIAICPRGDFSEGSGERTGLPTQSFDAVTIGSAFHWMEPLAAREEVRRILRPRGALLVYEYQFPKAAALAELNEWIRREFNLRWKAPGQKPRGAFDAVTACFRGDPGFVRISDRRIPMVQSLDSIALTGLILSQSRVLHYENGLTPEEGARFRVDLGRRMAEMLGNRPAEFDFSLTSALFYTQ